MQLLLRLLPPHFLSIIRMAAGGPEKIVVAGPENPKFRALFKLPYNDFVAGCFLHPQVVPEGRSLRPECLKTDGGLDGGDGARKLIFCWMI